MDKKKKPFYKSPWLWLIIAIFIGANFAPTENEVGADFSDMARDRFNNIQDSFNGELEINCLGGNCNSVTYFNWLSEPQEGLESITRLNAASFSKFKQDNGNGSRVTIYSELNGSLVLQCNASNGVVNECE